MIRPDKNTDPRFSVLNVGGYIIRALQDDAVLTFKQLLDYLVKETNEDVKAVYMASLSFLFALGKLEYHPHSDSFQLVK